MCHALVHTGHVPVYVLQNICLYKQIHIALFISIVCLLFLYLCLCDLYFHLSALEDGQTPIYKQTHFMFAMLETIFMAVFLLGHTVDAFLMITSKVS
jgi:hypothetical protein